MAATTEYDQTEMGLPRKFRAPEESSPGDFYVIRDECITCGAPHAVAPDLVGWLTDERGEPYHCYWKKQPSNSTELQQAFEVFDASEVGCHRYSGSDPSVIARVGRDYCDYSEFAGPPIAPSPPSPTQIAHREFSLTLIESRQPQSPWARWGVAARFAAVIRRLLPSRKD